MLLALIAAVSGGNCPPTQVGCPGYTYPQPVLLWVLLFASIIFLSAVLFGWRRQ
jgi:hypothetical protein